MDADGQTPYDCAVAQNNPDLIEILKPILSSTGEDITGIAHATNNPKHPQFRPEARDALFALFEMNAAALSASDTTSAPFVTG